MSLQCKVKEIKKILESKGVKLKERESLSEHTTIKIGGRVSLMVFPESPEEAIFALNTCFKKKIEAFILGGGSNLLVGDNDFEGVVLNLKNLKGIKVVEEEGDNCKLRIMAGTMVNQVISFSLKKGFSGLEFLAGVPASLGGAVKMNAGAFGSDMAGLVEKIKLWRKGEFFWLSPKQGDWAYREFKPEGVILEVELKLKKMDKESLKQRLCNFLKERLSKQPLGKRTFGSVFKNPERDFAGRLIEKCGLKGKRIGEACISEKHANFIENLGKARAAHVLELIELSREKVFKSFGVLLEPEVRFLACEIK